MVQFNGESLQYAQYLSEDDSPCHQQAFSNQDYDKHFAILKMNTVGKGLPTNHEINSEKSSVEP